MLRHVRRDDSGYELHGERFHLELGASRDDSLESLAATKTDLRMAASDFGGCARVGGGHRADGGHLAEALDGLRSFASAHGLYGLEILGSSQSLDWFRVELKLLAH